jgi:hypothetical protein
MSENNYWWAKVILYGHLGILLEFYFTAVGSLLKKNWRATGSSYLYMLPIYGFTALLFEVIGARLPWPFYLKGFVYVPVIYGVEAFSGYVLRLLTGSVPWEYKHSKWAPAGLVELRYAGFWYVLALVFELGRPHFMILCI